MGAVLHAPGLMVQNRAQSVGTLWAALLWVIQVSARPRGVIS